MSVLPKAKAAPRTPPRALRPVTNFNVGVR